MRMLQKKILISVIVFSLILASCSGGGTGNGQVSTSVPSGSETTTSSTPYSPPHQRPGPAVDLIEFSQHGVDQAVADLKNGKIDLYLFGLKLAAAQQLKNVDGAKAYRAPSGSTSLILNPAPTRRTGELNPFSLIEVRKAMQFLVNRDFIANSIYGGFAIPQISHVTKLDYDYLTVAGVIADGGIRYDPDLAKRMITNAMKDAGAELVNGKWSYQGKVIKIKFIIRVEDERRESGDAIRASLESLGFEVVPIYKQFAAAIFTVYNSDPQSFEWHIYTEGWGSGGADRYDFAKLNQFTAPWMAQMPGWQIFGFWQYENDKLDELGKKIFTGNFSNREERDILYQEATKISLEESVRIWLVTTYNTFPATQELTGVTEDIVSGPRSMLTLREAYIPGKNKLRVGNLWIWTARSVWNPVGGFGDVYSIDIWKNLYDPAIINDPFRGTPIPFRINFEIETAGSDRKLEVAKDAVMWNAVEDRWDRVPEGTQATSRVVFDFSKYFQSVWHHNQPIEMADVLYSLASTFDRTYDLDKRQIEFVLAATSKPLLDVFRGFRVLDDNRIEVYLDYWHFDESYIASYADISGLVLPWEIQAASDELVFERGMAAYSSSSAARYNVPWLSLAEKNGGVLLNKMLKDFSREQYLPEGVFTVNGVNYFTVKDAQARYAAAIEWFSEKSHMVISNGPFTLERYDPPAQYAELRAFRHESYPFKPGDWYRERPVDIIFENVDTEGDTVKVALSGPGELELRYLAVNPRSGAVEESGVATRISSNEFEVNLDSETLKQFRSGNIELLFLAVSDELSLVKEYKVFR